MGTRRILITWCLLLLFTMLFGVLTMRLLKREQARLGQAADASARERLELAADSVRITLSGLRQTILDEVKALPPDELVAGLTRLERGNPLVRNSFVWSPNKVLLHPQVGKASDPETVEFAERYALLFEGSVAWRAKAGDLEEAPSKMYSIEQTLQQADRISQRTGKSSWQPRQSTRWISWHWLDQLYLLGVVFDDERGLVYGVELETVALLARLHASLPETMEPGTSISLQDRNGEIIHRVGEAASGGRKAPSPELRVPVGPLLDTYQMVGTGLVHGVARRQRSSLLLSWLQVATFMLAILGTGSLLLWQAHRNVRDARMKTGFVSNVSHELKTPLTTIRMYAELLGENRVSDPAKREAYLGVIVKESQRLARLVNNVLDFGRLEQDRRTYRVETIDLIQFLPALLNSHQFSEMRPDSPITWSADCDTCPVRADADALEQILLNIIDNARKYAPAGDVALRIDGTGLPAVEIHVLDRGQGVPSGHARKVFDTFHRVDDSLTAGQAGSGLGLSIARRLARGMGGDLRYTDREGGGADFVVTLESAGNQAC